MSEPEVPPKKTRRKPASASRLGAAWRVIRRWFWRGLFGGLALLLLWVAFFGIVNPPAGVYMRQEAARLGGISRIWVAADEIAPVMLRAAVAAEDANFCAHWGFDMAAIRQTLDRGSRGGASTISQQVVKNVFLWHGRSWLRKALEAVITPVMETTWSKRRILEVYLNIAEFDEGVFGVEAAAQHYFGVSAAKLSATQAARLAMVLPNPKDRSASRPSAWQRKRTGAIIDGAQTIAADGRAGCFQP